MDHSALSSQSSARILSSVRRQERTVHRIYRDISSLECSIGCLSSKIYSHRERIGRLQEDLRSLTESIVQKRGLLQRAVIARKGMDISPVMNSPSSGLKPLPEEEIDLTCSETLTPDATPSRDTPCCVMPSPPRDLEKELESLSNGSMDLQEWEKVEWLMNGYL